MARTPEGRLLTAAHMRQQLALRASVIRDVVKLFPMWDPRDAASYKRFEDTMVMLVQSRATNSAALAARYYDMFKNVDAPGPVLTWGESARLAAPPIESEIRAAVSATARAGTYRALGAGQPYEAAMRNGLVQVSGAVTRHVLNAGRDTILGAVQQESGTVGWIRVSDGAPCAFCAMLLSRGPVYLTFASAGNKAAAEDHDFDWHDRCACSAEPFFEGSQWPEQNQQLREQWDATTGGYSGGDAINAFRRSLSGSAE